jgi:hypothetical protein
MAKATTLWLVVGGGLLAGVAGVVAMVKLGAPAQGREEGRAQIEAWQPAWTAARDCYLGAPRAAATPGDAIAIRTLLGETPHCAAEVAALSRPAGVSTGVDDIEQAWADVEAAVQTMARTDLDKKGPMIARAEAAVAALYAAAGMEPPAAPASTRAIAPLALGPAIAGSVGAGDVAVRGHAVVAQLPQADGAASTTLVIRGPADVTVVREAPASARAVPDGSWAAAIESASDQHRADDADGAAVIEDAVVTAGPVGPDGEVGAGATVVVKGKLDAVLAAAGRGANRAVVVRYADGVDRVAVVRSADSGKTWAKPARIPGSRLATATADRVTGAVDLFWAPAAPDEDGELIDGTGQVWWHVVDGGAARPIAFGNDPSAGDTCLTGGALWFHTDTLGRATADGAPAVAIAGPPDIRACTATAVVAIDGKRVHRCTAAGCDDGMEVRSPEDQGMNGRADVFDVAGALYAQQAGDAIAVWRTGVEPVFVRAPAGATLVAAVSWGPDQYLGVIDATGLRFAKVP